MTIESKLRQAVEKEKVAMRRLRLAQTVYDRHHDRVARLMAQMFEQQDQIARVVARLEGDR